MNEYFYSMYTEDYLEHHGILGMHWGIRRFQNKDGSLTSAGKNRYKTDEGDGETKPKMTRAEKKAAKAEVKAAKAEAKAAKEKEQVEEAKKKAIATANVDEIIKLRSHMTTSELNDAMKRVTALSVMDKNRPPKKKSSFEKAVSALGSLKTGADALTSAHKSIRELKNEFGLGKKSSSKPASDTKPKNNSENKADTNSKTKTKSKSDGKDAADRAFDLYNKIKADHDKRKFNKELSGLREREKTNNWISKLSSVGDITSVKLPDISPSPSIRRITTPSIRRTTSRDTKSGNTSISVIADKMKQQMSTFEKQTSGLDDLNKRFMS